MCALFNSILTLLIRLLVQCGLINGTSFRKRLSVTKQIMYKCLIIFLSRYSHLRVKLFLFIDLTIILRSFLLFFTSVSSSLLISVSVGFFITLTQTNTRTYTHNISEIWTHLTRFGTKYFKMCLTKYTNIITSLINAP